eukprot:GHVO01053676.1.p1 GENE.GHVO01053676.1~~GHVO01053676.1.p1  ORF type:complete len:109 (-),score=17.08 GHVO01053676.1:19-345(-)
MAPSGCSRGGDIRPILDTHPSTITLRTLDSAINTLTILLCELDTLTAHHDIHPSSSTSMALIVSIQWVTKSRSSSSWWWSASTNIVTFIMAVTATKAPSTKDIGPKIS